MGAARLTITSALPSGLLRAPAKPGLAIAALVAGCGRIGFAAEHDAVAPLDILDESVLAQPFGPVMPLSVLHGPGDDDDPSMTEDGLELYFSSNRIGGVDRVFRSQRASVADAWPAPVEVTVLGTSANNARISLDGLTLYFASDSRTDSESDDVYRATRASRSDELGPPQRVADVSTPSSEYEPCVASTTSAMFFTSDRVAGDQDLYVAPRLDSGMFGPAVRLAELSTTNYEGGTWASADGLRLWFHGTGPTGRVLLQTQRASIDLPFDAPVPIPGLESAFDDQDPWVSPDGRTIVFASDRGGTPDLYFATR